MLATIYEREIPTAKKCTKEHGYRAKLLIWILKLYWSFAVPVAIDVQPRPQGLFPDFGGKEKRPGDEVGWCDSDYLIVHLSADFVKVFWSVIEGVDLPIVFFF